MNQKSGLKLPVSRPPKDRSKKAQLAIGSRTCQCSMCDLYFAGPTVFDKHFKNMAYQCRTPEEMEAIGMTQNEHGLWSWGQWGGKPNK